MLQWFQSWKRRQKIKRLVRQMGSLLKSRYGFQEYYSPEQALRTAEVANLDEEGKAMAVAMYVQPEKAISILSKMASSKWGADLRKIMMVECFGFSDGSYNPETTNMFMHHPSASGHHGGGLFGSSDGGHHHGGGHHGGHSGGDHGGGDSGGGDSGGGH